MIDNYIPYKIYKTVFDVDYKYLLTLRVKVLLFDIDNTLLPYGVDEPDDKLIELFDYLKKLGFIICLISNNLSIVGLVLTVTIFDLTSLTNLDAFSVEVVNIEVLYLLPL